MKRKMKTEYECFVCQDGGELLECNACPRVYHIECVGLECVPLGSWSCPWHRCQECDRTKSTAGNVLFTCMDCPRAYCYDCLPGQWKRRDPSLQYLLRLKKMGYEPRSLVWIECEECIIYRENIEREQEKGRQQDRDRTKHRDEERRKLQKRLENSQQSEEKRKVQEAKWRQKEIEIERKRAMQTQQKVKLEARHEWIVQKRRQEQQQRSQTEKQDQLQKKNTLP